MLRITSAQKEGLVCSGHPPNAAPEQALSFALPLSPSHRHTWITIWLPHCDKPLGVSRALLSGPAESQQEQRNVKGKGVAFRLRLSWSRQTWQAGRVS